MQILLMVLIALHVLAGVFWAGSTFALARLGGTLSERLAKPQLGAATLAVLTGLALWGLLHRHGFGHGEFVLGLGALTAIIAAGVQSGIGLPAVRRLASTSDEQARPLRKRIAIAQRIAALCLFVTVVCMAVFRYA